MELVRYWKIIQKSLWLVIILMIVGAAGAVLATLNQKPVYESTASLLLNPSAGGNFVPRDAQLGGQTLADSYTELMRSQAFGDLVVKELPFTMHGSSVAKAISTKLALNTYFFKITADMNSPEKSQQVLNAVIKVFLSNNNGAQDTTSSMGSDPVKNDMRTRLQTKLKDLETQIKSYQDEITALQAQPATAARDDRLLVLRGQLITLQQDETSTIAAIAGIGNTNGPVEVATVVDHPAPGKQLSSGLTTNLGLALAVSLVLGIGLAFVRDYLDYSVHSPEELEDVLGLHAVATIGVLGKRKKGRRKGKAVAGEHVGHKLVTLDNPNSPESENFRVLRTNIQFSSLERSIRSLEVTSSSQGEGKSFIASNLAIVMAQAGKRVILIDADLRRPSLHELFGLPNEVGFTDLVLAGSNGVAGAVQMVPGVNNLAVITSGTLPPNPSELLDSRQAAKVIEQLTQQTDIVIFDSPPAGAVTDPIVLATRVDAVIMVISAGMTRRDAIARTMQSLQNVGVVALLPVLNRVVTKGMQGFYGYRRSQHETREATPVENGSFANGKVPAHVGGVETTPTGSQRATPSGR
jgi:succinoglycan biosynthesis transport protein ExoP